MLLQSIVNGGVVLLAPNMKLKQSEEVVTGTPAARLACATHAPTCFGSLTGC